jgi:hypothetical protein
MRYTLICIIVFCDRFPHLVPAFRRVQWNDFPECMMYNEEGLPAPEIIINTPY